MRPARHVLPVAGLAAAFTLVACAGTETGNGGDEQRHRTKVELKLTDSDELELQAVYAGSDRDGATLLVSEAWVHLERFELELPAGVSCELVGVPTAPASAAIAYTPHCTNDHTITVTGPWWVDLITGTTEPPLSTIALPQGDYSRVDLRLSPGDLPSATAHDGASTLFARGELEVDGESRPFALDLSFTAPMHFGGQAAVDGELKALLLLFNVRAWFGSVAFASCARDGQLGHDADGALLLHEGRGACVAAAQLLTVAIRSSGSLAERREPRPR